MGFFFTNKTFFFSSLALNKKWKPALLLFPRASSKLFCLLPPGRCALYSPLTAACSLVQFHGKTEQKVLLSKALQKEWRFHLKPSSSSRSLPCREENAQGSGNLSLWGKRVIKDTQLCVGAITGWSGVGRGFRSSGQKQLGLAPCLELFQVRVNSYFKNPRQEMKGQDKTSFFGCVSQMTPPSDLCCLPQTYFKVYRDWLPFIKSQ